MASRCSGADAGVRHGPHHVADDARHRSHQREPVAEVDVDLDRLGLGGSCPPRLVAASTMSSTTGTTSSRTRSPKAPGGSDAAHDLGRRRRRPGPDRRAGARAAAARRSTARARSSSIGRPSAGSSSASLTTMPSRWRRKALTGCCTNRTRSSSSTRSDSTGGSGAVRNAGVGVRPATEARAPSSDTRSKLHGPPGTSAPSVKLRTSNGWSGWCTTTRSRAASTILRCGGGPVDHVEQLAERHGRRAGRVRALVAAGVGDDEVIGRGEHGVEQQLAVLAAGIAVAHARSPLDDVVAVRRGPAGEHPVVEAEEADDAVRHRAHRHEGAHREVAGAEVRPGRPAPEAVGEQRLGSRRGRGAMSRRRLAPASATMSRRMRSSSRRCHGSQARTSRSRASAARAMASAQASIGLGSPTARSTAASRRSMSSASRPARSMSPLSTSSSGRTPTDEAELVLGHRDPEQDAVEPGPPGVGAELVERRTGLGARRRAPIGSRSPRPSPRCGRGRRRRGGSGGGPAPGWRGRSPATRSPERRPGRAARRRAARTGFVWRSERSARRTRRSGNRRAGRSRSRLVHL